MTDTIRGRVAANIELDLEPYRDARHANFLRRLKKAASFPNPEVERRKRLRLETKFLPQKICVMRDALSGVVLPRGSVRLVRELAKLEGLAIEFDDRRVTLPLTQCERADTVPILPSSIKLRSYQTEAIEKLERVAQGLAIFPCGAGKTFTGIAAMARIGEPTIVLVHTTDLARQWREEIKRVLGIEPGMVGSGENDPRHITIAMAQTLLHYSEAELSKLLGNFGMLVVDEAHHCPSDLFSRIVSACPARYRLGLTATPEREDGLTPLLSMHFGEVLKQVTYEDLIALKILVAPEVCVRETSFKYTSRLHADRDFRAPGAEAAEYARILDALENDEARNEQIAADIIAEAQAGHSCLVLSSRVKHCAALAELVSEAGVTAAVLTGAVPKKRRAALLHQARTGELRVLIATTLADEGLDVPCLSRLFLAFPGKSKGRTTQRLGRIMRSSEGKDGAILFDYCDKAVPSLRRHFNERRKLYCELLGVPASKSRTRTTR